MTTVGGKVCGDTFGGVSDQMRLGACCHTGSSMTSAASITSATWPSPFTASAPSSMLTTVCVCVCYTVCASFCVWRAWVRTLVCVWGMCIPFCVCACVRLCILVHVCACTCVCVCVCVFDQAVLMGSKWRFLPSSSGTGGRQLEELARRSEDRKSVV